MATVQNMDSKRITLRRDSMSNGVSSTSSEDGNSNPIVKYNNYKIRYRESASDNEITVSKPIQRDRYKSLGNIADYNDNNTIQNSVNVSHSGEIKKFDTLRIPIVGYEVMEERARFTIYKLKVEDDKRDRSWLVFRRYTDFVRLYNRLKNEQPDINLPLPGKRWFRDNFKTAFLEERAKGLQIFVNAILSTLPNNKVVREFFCLDEPPQDFSYEPEVQAVYGALEDTITSFKAQLKQKNATIMHLAKRVALLEDKIKNCPTCTNDHTN